MKISNCICLASALFLAPFEVSAQPAQTEIVPPRVAADALSWRFAPLLGSRWQIRFFTRIESKSVTPFADGTPDERAQLTSWRSLVADYEVLSRDSLGATTSRITLRQTRFASSGVIDGEPTVSTFPDARIMAIQNAFRDASFTIKQAPTGEIWSVAGREAIRERLAKAIAPFNANDAEQTRAQSQKMVDFLLGDGSLRQVLGLAQPPSYPVVTSESWPYQIALPIGYPFQFDLTGQSKLNRLTPELAFVASNATYDASNASVPPVYTRVGDDFVADTSSVKASVRIASRVERKSGLTLESTASWRINSTLVSRPADAPDAPTLRDTGAATIEIHTLLVPR